MGIYLFRSGCVVEILAFTLDETGANLPSMYGPWTPNDGGLLPVGSDQMIDAVKNAFESQGYYLMVPGPSDAESGDW